MRSSHPPSFLVALLPSFKCRTSPRLFDGPLAELTLIKQLNPPASLVVRSLCVQKRTLHSRASGDRPRPRDRRRPMQLATDNGYSGCGSGGAAVAASLSQAVGRSVGRENTSLKALTLSFSHLSLRESPARARSAAARQPPHWPGVRPVRSGARPAAPPPRLSPPIRGRRG